MAYVSETESPENGVAQGMDGDIAVRMGDKSLFGRYLHSTKMHREPFPQGMDIIAVSYPYVFHKTSLFRKFSKILLIMGKMIQNDYFCGMGMFNFSFFGDQERRSYNYRPRFYDPDKDRLRSTQRKEEDSDREYVPGEFIKRSFSDHSFQKTRSTGNRAQNIIGIIGLLLLAAVIFMMIKFYSIL